MCIVTTNMTLKKISSSIYIRRRYYHSFPFIHEINYNPSSLDDQAEGLLWSQIYNKQQPVVIRSLISSWNAVSHPSRRWSDLSQLRDRVLTSSTECNDSIIVPVEIGDSYMDEKLSKQFIEFNHLLDLYMSSGQDCHSHHYKNNAATNSHEQQVAMPRIYLAQYDVDEIHVLRDDIKTPRLCSTGKGSVYKKNIWFGSPQGTISPCHHDPFQNVLCQVVGEKEIIIFDPSLDRYLYPAINTVQKNTSLVDINKPDLNKYPLYKEILNLVENNTDKGGNDDNEAHTTMIGRTILYPGDAVYIPFKWWHYCKTSTLSCSINYWWL